MDIQLADVTLHIDQSLNTEELEKLEIAIRKKGRDFGAYRYKRKTIW